MTGPFVLKLYGNFMVGEILIQRFYYFKDWFGGEMKDLWIVFASVFLAELGDKTQLATLMFATNEKISKLGVFGAASVALVLSVFLAVVFGNQVSAFISTEKLKIIVGIGFILIGIWTLKEALLPPTLG